MKLFIKIILLIFLLVSCQKEKINEEAIITKTHIVTEGETLFRIARKYNISVDELYRLNPEIKNDSTEWKVGLELKVLF